MTTVTIYKITCTRGYQISEQGSRYSLRPLGAAYCEGHDDGGKLYQLPPGYRIDFLWDSDEMGIFDQSGIHCIIVPHGSGRPQLSSGGHDMPVLSEA